MAAEEFWKTLKCKCLKAGSPECISALELEGDIFTGRGRGFQYAGRMSGMGRTEV